jgi:hypothetical protein
MHADNLWTCENFCIPGALPLASRETWLSGSLSMACSCLAAWQWTDSLRASGQPWYCQNIFTAAGYFEPNLKSFDSGSAVHDKVRWTQKVSEGPLNAGQSGVCFLQELNSEMPTLSVLETSLPYHSQTSGTGQHFLSQGCCFFWKCFYLLK